MYSCISIKITWKTWYNTKKKSSYKEQCTIKVKKYLNEITGIQGYIYREYARTLKVKKVYEKTMDSDFFEKCFKEMFLKNLKKIK